MTDDNKGEDEEQTDEEVDNLFGFKPSEAPMSASNDDNDDDDNDNDDKEAPKKESKPAKPKPKKRLSYEEYRNQISDCVTSYNDENRAVIECPLPGCDWKLGKTSSNQNTLYNAISGMKMSLGRHLKKHFPSTKKKKKKEIEVYEDEEDEEDDDYYDDEEEDDDYYDDDDEEEDTVSRKRSKKKKKKGRRRRREKDFSPSRPEVSDVPTLEEEMKEEMYNKLEEILSKVPGVGSGRRRSWVLECFANDRRFQEDERSLYEFLARHFPKMDKTDLHTVVSSVFSVRDDYEEAMMRTDGPYFDYRGRGRPSHDPYPDFAHGRERSSPYSGRRSDPYGYPSRRGGDQAPSGYMTPEEVMRMIDEREQERERRRWEREEKRKLVEKVNSVEERMNQQILDIMDEFETVIDEKLSNLGPDDDKESIKELLLENNLELRDRMLDMKEKEQQHLLEEMKKDREAWERERQEMFRRLDGSGGLEDFDQDDARIFAIGARHMRDLGDRFFTESRQFRRDGLKLAGSILGKPTSRRRSDIKIKNKEKDMPSVTDIIDEDLIDEE